MNHAITVADLFHVLGAFIGLGLAGFGLLIIFAGGMSDAPDAGRQAGRTGCIIGLVGIALLALILTACATPPPVTKVQTVEVKVPVWMNPLRPDQVPTPPAALPKRSGNLAADADTLLAKVCEFVAYAVQADPLLRISAGEKPALTPAYPECAKH